MITNRTAKEREHDAYLRGVRVGERMEDYSGLSSADVLAGLIIGCVAFSLGVIATALFMTGVECIDWDVRTWALFTPVGMP